MFDIGGPELLFLIVLALLVFGPRRLPQLGRQLGEQVARLRRNWSELQGSLEREVALEDLKRAQQEMRSLQQEVRRARRELIAPVRTESNNGDTEKKTGA